MTVATSEARRGPAGQLPRQDRRNGAGNRVQFEALVEVGAGMTGGFEAESVDVSPAGMRLRTAYLPEPGERLVCRFDGLGGEVVAEGEVIWCAEQGRGGEFGVRFTRLDPRAAALLKDLCAEEEEQAAEGEPEAGHVSRGARVRLHIQGLGSPMRARVRDAAPGEVLIGSNLEFLRVGRDVQLEDVDGGCTQVAQIEHVDVAVDPETNIPQLIVALRYEGCPADAEQPDQTTAPVRVARKAMMASARAQAVAETTPEPTVIDEEGETVAAPPSEAVADAAQDRAMRAQPRYDDDPRIEVNGETDEVFEDDEAEPRMDAAARQANGRTAIAPEPEPDESDAAGEEGPAARLAGAKARLGAAMGMVAPAVGKLGPALGKLGPLFSGAARGTSSAFGRVLARVRQRREAAQARKQESKAAGPLRTTAPPPSGALRSDGRRLFRSKEQPPTAEVPARKGSDRKRTAFGIALGLLAVATIYGVAHKVSAWQRAQAEPPPALSKPAELVAGQGAPGSNLAVGADGAPIASANVPLFGATPLSTTEPVPVPTGVDEAMADDKADDGAEPGAAADADAKPLALDKEWGVGSVENPTVLKIKMDGPIDGISGSEGATGFTLVIPNRKSVSSASGLARKDKRIEAVNVVNFPDRCEVTLQFKSEVPAFLARTKDKNLIIEVGADGAKKGSGSHEVSSSAAVDDEAPKKAHSKKSDSKKSDSKKSDSKKSDSKKSDSKKSDSKKSDSKKSDSKKSDSKKSDSKKSDGKSASGDSKKGDKAAEQSTKTATKSTDKKAG